MKVAIYCRLSEEDRDKLNDTDDSNSIKNQKALLIEYALERGWEIFNIYSDDDYAGADRNRPDFNRLLKDAESKKFDILLCKTQSRFTRELELVEKYIHGKFIEWNIRFIGVLDNADTQNKGNKKARQINGLINEWFLEDLSENIKGILTNKRKNGLHIGAFPLYGYKKDTEQKGHLIIDEEPAKIVKEIFSLYNEGYGKTAIARLLNEKGTPTPAEYKHLNGIKENTKRDKINLLWKYYTISDILKNEIYLGNMVQGRYGSVSYKTGIIKPIPKDKWIKVEGTHEPIITKELWDKVQSKINKNLKPFVTGKIGIFSRKVKCMYCNYTMHSSKTREKFYLRCGSKTALTESCEGGFIPVELLEKIILTELNKIIDVYLNKTEFEQSINFNSDLKHKKNILSNDINMYAKKINECSNNIKTLYGDRLKGIISEDDFVELSKDFSKDRERYEKISNYLKNQISTIDEKISKSNNVKKLLEPYINVTKLERYMIDELIDVIYIGKKQKGSKDIPIKIEWNF